MFFGVINIHSIERKRVYNKLIIINSELIKISILRLTSFLTFIFKIISSNNVIVSKPYINILSIDLYYPIIPHIIQGITMKITLKIATCIMMSSHLLVIF